MVGTTLVEVAPDHKSLQEIILREGRIILSSRDLPYNPRDPSTPGEASNVIDGDFNSAVLLPHPSGHREGTYLLMDMALTHHPSQDGLQPRRTLGFWMYMGGCADCPPETFHAYSRPKQGRLELLYRRANDPDQEFIIPPAHIIVTVTVHWKDTPSPQWVSLHVPDPAYSAKYPENVNYIIAKLYIDDVYPGKKFPDIVAIREIVYMDGEIPEIKGKAGELSTQAGEL